MIDVIFNPKGIEPTFIRNINYCFGHWGEIDMYKWCFHRQVGDLKADIMIIQKEGKIIAGSAVTYRKVMLANNSMVNAGIMTGSWTLPEARRQGCFTRIIEESVALASSKGAAFLLGIGAKKNASFGSLSKASSALFPTFYLFTGDNTPVPQSDCVIFPVTDIEKGIETIFGRLKNSQDGLTHFSYTLKEWRSQFWDRPGKMEFLSLNDIGFVIMEKQGEFDRILMLSLYEGMTFGDCMRALLKRSLLRKRKLFFFTAFKSWRNACMKLGMEHTPGQVYTLVANESALLKAYPHASTLANIGSDLYNSRSRWYMGSWDIQSGDRM